MKTPWLKSGSAMIWLNAGGLAASLTAVIALSLFILMKGFAGFWPQDIEHFLSNEGKWFYGKTVRSEFVPTPVVKESGLDYQGDALQLERHIIQIGARDFYGLDFRPIFAFQIKETTKSPTTATIERLEHGSVYGEVVRMITLQGEVVENPQDTQIQQELARVQAINQHIRQLEHQKLTPISRELNAIRLAQKKAQQEKNSIEQREVEGLTQTPDWQEKVAPLEQAYRQGIEQLDALRAQAQKSKLEVLINTDTTHTVHTDNVLRVFRPNQLSFIAKLGIYFKRLWEFVSEPPREANTAGGIFPALFGTSMLVIVMSVIVTPFGVVAAIYLREYAHQGWLTNLIRVAVNNLAGVPSVVFGIFGLGFFVYLIGGQVDELFFSESLPSPTFGTPGILWAALTLALLTLPVVIVSTEEGLARTPKSVVEGSLALGATKFESIFKVAVPMASPAIMTGLILAIARAAGEVAPLMLVGAVKIAPSLPIDAVFPYLHLDRKFMHLGFHIYDIGFQSPNVEATRPLVYATSSLLLMLIISLNLTAIIIRNRLREKFRMLDH